MMRVETVAKPAGESFSRGALPGVQDLEDVLYDLLAAGIDPGAAPGTLHAVQILLHEHARSPKSQPELLAFFDAHGLSATRLPEASAPFALPNIELPEIELAPAAISGMQVDPAQLSAFAPKPRAPQVLRWTAAACLVALLSAGVSFGYSALQALRADLASVRAQSTAQAQALATVKAEAQTLRASVAETTTKAERAAQNSELLLQTYASPLDPASR